MKTWIKLLTVVVLLAGCSKEKETVNNVDPAKYFNKSDFVEMGVTTSESAVKGQTPRIFSMVRAIDEADSRNTFYAVPGFQYDMGTVKAVITETALEFRSTVEWDNNQNAPSIVVAYPITKHFDLVKAKNDFGEETNQLIEETKRHWSERGQMRVDWSKPLNSKGTVANQLWSIGELHEENVAILKEPQFDEKGHLSFQTESSIREMGGGYYDEMGNLVGGSYQVRTTTFLIPHAGTGYKPRDYPNEEFGKYGLFRTFENFVDPERGPMDKTVKRYANLFNVCEAGGGACSTNKIVYHITEFPENEWLSKAKFIEMTQQAINQWNAAFKKALNRTDDIVTLDLSQTVSISDPRYNVIAWYPENTEAGLLGVSQTRVDSATGETLNARATQYLSGIKYGTARVEDYVNDLMSAGGIPGCTVTVQSMTTEITPELVLGNMKMPGAVQPLRAQGIPTSLEKVAKAAYESSKGNLVQAFQRRNILWEKEAGTLTPIDNNILKKTETLGLQANEFWQDALLNKQTERRKKEKKIELKAAVMGVHGAELVDEATKHYVAKFASMNKGLCPKAGSKDATKFIAALKKDVAALTYYTTVLHEMGHNFGLRHNFHGSADQEKNYHPKYLEIKKAITTGPNPNNYTELDLDFYAYTSVMDYSAAFYEVQGGLGPYDIAAIRYAYNRNLPAKDPVKTADFKFCTDHLAGEDSLCTRHDKGTNVSLATLNNIERFNRGYTKSHFRRGRADFDNYFLSVIYGTWQRTLIPTRQVMDEFIYQIIMSPPAAQNDLGCTSQFMLTSVAAGEIANVCDAAIAEENGVNLLDWSTMVYGLFEKDSLKPGQKPKFRKDPRTYLPNGFADLVMANAMARDLFMAIIGSPEADMYLLEDKDATAGTKQLTKLPYGATNEQRLANLAMERNVANIQQFIKDGLPNLVDIQAGPITAATPATNYRINPVGSIFTSQVSLSGGYEQLENVGFLWDKYVAMITLGMRYIGVEKYARASMMGNAYLWPQGKKWTTDVVDAMATNRPHLAQSYVTTRGGKTHLAYVPASTDINMQAIAIMVGIADLATDTDSSFADKLRMCDSTDAMKCEPKLGQPAIQFDTASGTNFYKAVQTIYNDSIGFSLVAGGKVFADQRKEALAAVANSAQLLASAKAKMTAGNGKRGALEALFNSEASLKHLSATVTAATGTTSVWMKSQDVINNLNNYGIFKTLGWRDEAVNVIVDAFNQVEASTVSTAKKQQIQQAIIDYVSVLVQIQSPGTPGSLDDVVMIKIAPELVKMSSDDLSRQETMINLARRYMKWLAID
jgi:hypothetical protein